MGEAENKALVQRFYDEVWDRGNIEFAHEVLHDDYIRHDLRPTQAAPGAAGMAAIAAGFRAAFPDAHWRVDFRNGKVAEIWNRRDDLGLMQQVGALVYAGAADDGGT